MKYVKIGVNVGHITIQQSIEICMTLFLNIICNCVSLQVKTAVWIEIIQEAVLKSIWISENWQWKATYGWFNNRFSQVPKCQHQLHRHMVEIIRVHFFLALYWLLTKYERDLQKYSHYKDYNNGWILQKENPTSFEIYRRWMVCEKLRNPSPPARINF